MILLKKFLLSRTVVQRTPTPHKYLISDQRILDIVEGCHIEFETEPMQCCYPGHIMYSEKKQKKTDVIKLEIDKLLQKGVITRTSGCAGQFLSTVFTHPKKNNI